MAVIQYRDKFGNVRTVNSIKGDRGPIGPRGPQGPKGPKGDKGGTLIRGSMPTLEELKEIQHLLNINIGDGYIIEDEEKLYIWNGEYWVESPAWIPVKLDHLIDVTIPDTSVKHSDILVYDANIGQWTNKPLDVDSGIFTTSEDILITETVGGYKKGDIIPAGTKFQVFVKNLLGRPIPPEYIKPSLDVSSNIDVLIYRGQTIAPVIKPVFNIGDAGPVKFCHLYRNDQKIDTFINVPESIFTHDYQINENVTYKVVVEYSDGDIKLDSEGNPYEEGRILAGTVENSITIKPGIPYWNYESTSHNIPNVMDIMTSQYTDFNLSKDSKLEVNCKEGTRSIIFAYPAELGLCKNIEYVGFDPHSEDIFSHHEMNIYDANYLNPILYHVYCYISPIEIGTAKFILNL